MTKARYRDQLLSSSNNGQLADRKVCFDRAASSFLAILTSPTIDAMHPELNDDQSGVPGWLLVLGVVGGAIAFFWSKGDHVTASVLGVLAVAGFSGYRLGALKMIAFFGGAAAAVVYAPRFGRQLEPSVSEWLGTTGLANRAISIGAVGLGMTIGALLLAALLSRWLFADRPRLAACNKWVGFAVGGVQGGVLVLLAMGGLFLIEPMAKQRVVNREQASPLGRAVAKQVVNITEQTRGSKLGTVILTNNPFDHVPQLAKMKSSVRVISDPQRLNELIRHPLTQLKESPSLSRTIEKLTADPQIREVLESGKPVDQQTAMSLMNNPAVLEMLDDPDFLGEMSKMLGELDPETRSVLGGSK